MTFQTLCLLGTLSQPRHLDEDISFGWLHHHLLHLDPVCNIIRSDFAKENKENNEIITVYSSICHLYIIFGFCQLFFSVLIDRLQSCWWLFMLIIWLSDHWWENIGFTPLSVKILVSNHVIDPSHWRGIYSTAFKLEFIIANVRMLYFYSVICNFSEVWEYDRW